MIIIKQMFICFQTRGAVCALRRRPPTRRVSIIIIDSSIRWPHPPLNQAYVHLLSDERRSLRTPAAVFFLLLLMVLFVV